MERRESHEVAVECLQERHLLGHRTERIGELTTVIVQRGDLGLHELPEIIEVQAPGEQVPVFHEGDSGEPDESAGDDVAIREVATRAHVQVKEARESDKAADVVSMEGIAPSTADAYAA